MDNLIRKTENGTAEPQRAQSSREIMKTEVGSPKSEVRSRKSEVRS